ncbi:uncharacterized protein MONBRDRAFT_1942, partial [Monosiga brevicollis MX1]
FDKVVAAIRQARNIIMVTGAGISTSCGIPDFRSPDGLYARLKVDYPSLPQPEAMFDMRYFLQNPRPFFDFAKEIWPGLFQPSPSHKFVKALETRGQLRRDYTQNIDTLEQVAGISNIVQCHGSFNTASCILCKHQVTKEAIRDQVFAGQIPLCPNHICSDTLLHHRVPVLKPDITFFREDLPQTFYEHLESDLDVCDLVIVMGSSLQVQPVSRIPDVVDDSVPQILINREPLRHAEFSAELLGSCD